MLIRFSAEPGRWIELRMIVVSSLNGPPIGVYCLRSTAARATALARTATS